MKDLFLPLNDLNTWLKEEQLHLELTVIGAFALCLDGLSTVQTMDIDTVKEITTPKILDKIHEIGEKYGLPEWLNDRAKTIVMPEGHQGRLKKYDNYSNIKISYAHRSDLIKLKIAAYFYRYKVEGKDLRDLKLLSPSHDEIKQGIDFLLEKHRPDSEKFALEFEGEVKKIWLKLKEIFNE